MKTRGTTRTAAHAVALTLLASTINIFADTPTLHMHAPIENTANIIPKTKRERRKAAVKKAKKGKRFWERTTLNTMTYDELKVHKDKEVAAGNKEPAIKYLDRMLRLANNIDEIADLMIEYADLLFDVGKKERATSVYEEFAKLYPGDKNAEYALYKAILCSFYSILDADRDQTRTRETVALTDDFLSRPIFTKHKDEVQTIRTNCYERLIESELYICDFYLQRNSFPAVEKRLESVRNKLLPHIPDLENKILSFESEFATKKEERIQALTPPKQEAEQQTVAQQKQSKEEPSPDGTKTVAANTTTKQHASNRF